MRRIFSGVFELSAVPEVLCGASCGAASAVNADDVIPKPRFLPRPAYSIFLLAPLCHSPHPLPPTLVNLLIPSRSGPSFSRNIHSSSNGVEVLRRRESRFPPDTSSVTMYSRSSFQHSPRNFTMCACRIALQATSERYRRDRERERETRERVCG